MKNTLILRFLVVFLSVFSSLTTVVADTQKVLHLDMRMPIFAGTLGYLDAGIEKAEREKFSFIVVSLSTPGGMLNVTQEMIEHIFASPVPIAIYVAPSGATSTSAGVFITMAAHVAAMAPGTSIGAAHPVDGSGADIKGDMRKKVENMAISLVESISKNRGRNTDWAKKSVKKSSTLTDDEAVKRKVVDFTASSIQDLLGKISGKKVLLKDKTVELRSLAKATIVQYDISFRHSLLNTLSEPNVAGLLWVTATTGLGVELTYPGLIFPGVVGVICLVLALISTQILSLSTGAISLIVLGTILLFSEVYFTTGLLGIGGLISIVVGMIYLVDPSQGVSVSLGYVSLFIIPLFSLVLFLAFKVRQASKNKELTGNNALQGQLATVRADFIQSEDKSFYVGTVLTEGEIWKAQSVVQILKGDKVTVMRKLEGLLLEVKPVN
jgi:membrane-bound serine protease (ClpP class)